MFTAPQHDAVCGESLLGPNKQQGEDLHLVGESLRKSPQSHRVHFQHAQQHVRLIACHEPDAVLWNPRLWCPITLPHNLHLSPRDRVYMTVPILSHV